MMLLANTAQGIQGEIYTIRKPMAAIEASVTETAPFGLLTQLPSSSTLTVLGPAFNDSLVTVRCHDAVYFVFIEDLVAPSVAV